MDGRQRQGPLNGSARGVGYIVAVGVVVLLGGVAVAAVLTWVMT